MKEKTEFRYWMEFYYYEQWLVDNNLLCSSTCYSLTNKMDDEYLTGLSGYVQMMKKKYKKNTVRVKVSRLIQCLRRMVSSRYNSNTFFWNYDSTFID